MLLICVYSLVCSRVCFADCLWVLFRVVAVLAFVLGMLLTPPDIISQTLLAVPMLLLFEVGIIIASFYSHKGENNLSEDIE